jgi:hypothetical protein
LDDKAVVKAVNAEIDRAESFMETRIARERALAYDYYYGRPFGNEQEGRSSVISADVAQAVDAAHPEVVEVFVSGDKAVEFTPRNAEDVESAEQATLGANYVFFTQNNGFALASDFIKDGLLQKTGVFKWKWDTSIAMSEKRYQGLDDATFQVLGTSPDAEIVEHSQNGPLHDVTVRIKKESGKVKVVVPPPEEILISPDSMTLEVMDMPFIAHTPLLTKSDLVEMGIDEKVIATLPKGDDRLDQEKIARDERNDVTAFEVDDDRPETYRYNECYIRLDVDGDGIAELRKICLVGDTILHNEPTDHIPMAIWTPKVMPHEVVGVSLADDVMDLQLLKSTVWRLTMDSGYQSLYPRLFVQGDVNMDDVLTLKPGGAIRGEIGSNLTPIAVPFVGQHGFQMLEYIDQEKDSRVGFSTLGPGMDPDSINKTATFVNAATAQTDSRKKMIARNAAEYGFKPLFRGITYLLAKHQQQALMVRLNNKFVPVDPETWNKEYDMTCNVGLGVGNKEQQLMHLQALGMDLQAIAQTPFAPLLLSAQKVYNYVEKKANLAGFKDVTVFLNNPVDENGQPLPPPPPPKPESVQVAEIKAQTDAQAFQAKLQGDAQTKQMDAQIDIQKLQMDQQREADQAQADMLVEQQKAELQVQLRREELAAEYAFKREEMALEYKYKLAEKQMEIAAQKEIAEMNAQVTLSTAAHTAEAGKAKEGEQNERSDGLMKHMATLVAKAAGPKKITRDGAGRATGIE